MVASGRIYTIQSIVNFALLEDVSKKTPRRHGPLQISIDGSSRKGELFLISQKVQDAHERNIYTATLLSCLATGRHQSEFFSCMIWRPYFTPGTFSSTCFTPFSLCHPPSSLSLCAGLYEYKRLSGERAKQRSQGEMKAIKMERRTKN